LTIVIKQCRAFDNNAQSIFRFSTFSTQTTMPEVLQSSYLAAQETRAKYVSKTLCGVDPIGLFTKFSVVMETLSNIVYDGKRSSINDGMVSWSSCSTGVADELSTDASTPGNYQASINHFDASFRNGDGWWGSDRKPVRWFECAL
jgi:hypothetical protein